MSPSELVAVLGAIALLLGAIGKLIVDVRSVHKLVNSRMTELLDVTRDAARARGNIEGHAARTAGMGPPDHDPR